MQARHRSETIAPGATTPLFSTIIAYMIMMMMLLMIGISAAFVKSFSPTHPRKLADIPWRAIARFRDSLEIGRESTFASGNQLRRSNRSISGQAQRVKNIAGGKPGPASLQDSAAQHVKAVGAVGVARNDDWNALRFGFRGGQVVQVQTCRVGVQFQAFAVGRRSRKTASKSTS